ncbi:MAG: ATP-grasp domain-containing protein [Gammaproteobacteria bacterium]
MFRNFRKAVPGTEATLICTHSHSTAAAFLAADECYLEPSELTGQDYIDWCLDFCRRHDIDLFWPCKEAALAEKFRPSFEAAGTRVMSVADFETLNLLQDKARFYTELNPEIAQTMDFVVVNDCNGFDRAVEELSAKHKRLCIKPAVSVYGLGFRLLAEQTHDIGQLLKGAQYRISLQELRRIMQNSPEFETLLVMEYLDGPEWSVDCAGRHGELLCAVQRKKSPWPGHGQTIGHHVEIAGMAERLTARYRLNGLFNIQFKEGPQGARLLEINARPSGGIGMACLSGANLAEIAWQGIIGSAPGTPAIQLGLRVTEINTSVVLGNG